MCSLRCWMQEPHTYDFGYTVHRPIQGQKVEFANATFWSLDFETCIDQTEYLFDRLKLAELTGSANCVSSTICPPTYIVAAERREANLPPPGADLRSPWFLKENLQNFGLGTYCVPTPRIEEIADKMKPGKDYVLQPHIARPALYTEGGGRRKFHLRLYILVAQRAEWARPPLSSAGGSRFYAHRTASKLVISPNDWDAADTSASTQVTTRRSDTKFTGWARRDAAHAAMVESAVLLVERLQTKLVTPTGHKTMFELVGADYMLDEDGKAWLLEVNTGPVMKEEDDTDLIRDIMETVMFGDGTPVGTRSPLLVPLPAVSWPRVPAWVSLEPSRRAGENAQKTRKNGEKWARYGLKGVATQAAGRS